MSTYIQLKKKKSAIIRHPWVYKNQIKTPLAELNAGAIIDVVDSEGQFIGRGYCNPQSKLTCRLLTFHQEPITKDFFIKRFKTAEEKRKNLNNISNAQRLIFSEADEVPGFFADRYDDTIVFQIQTLGMEFLKEMLVECLKIVYTPKYIFEKSDSLYRLQEGLKKIKRWWGDQGETVVKIQEGTARFLVDIENGHKTGFYLDQRKSRLALHEFSRNKRVLDVCSYIGGFSVHSALSGAHTVLAVDIKDTWLDYVKKNASLNNVSHSINTLKSDAFSVLDKMLLRNEQFDIIILDPPSFVKHEGAVKQALAGYKKLNTLAMRLISSNGILCTFSCSHHINATQFSDVVKESAGKAQRSVSILKRCHQDIDHPIVHAIPETEYLKGYFLKVT